MKLPSGDSSLKMPKEPPDFDSIFQQIQDKDRILKLYSADLDDSRYLHWDELRWRKAPFDWSREEWWFVTKLKRKTHQKTLALKDTKSRVFNYNVTNYMQEVLHRIDLGAGGLIQGSPAIANSETKDRYYISSLIQESITSSQLEGATTTRQIAKEMIKSGRPPRDKGERMILNNYAAMKRISELKSVDFSPERIFELHRIVTLETLDAADAAGRLRRDDEPTVLSDDFGTVYHTPPPASELRERMEAMCEFANANDGAAFIHPVVRAIVLHFWLAYDHPFVDGNGRTARALFYWAMMKSGYWLCEFLSISQVILKAPKKYYRAFLYTETDENDLTYFIHYHLKLVQKAVQELHSYIEKKTKQIRDLERRTRASTVLNHRQTALVTHALRHPGHPYTFHSHQISHGVVYQTARLDLIDLESKGLLKSSKRGKTYVFRAAPNIEELLENLEGH